MAFVDSMKNIPFVPNEMRLMAPKKDEHKLDVSTKQAAPQAPLVPQQHDWISGILGAIPGLIKGGIETANKPEGFNTLAALTADPYMKEALLGTAAKKEALQQKQEQEKKEAYSALASKAIEAGDMESGRALAKSAGIELPETMKAKEQWSNYGTTPVLQGGEYYIPQVSKVPDENGQPKIRMVPLPKGSEFSSTEGAPVNIELVSGEPVVGTYDKKKNAYVSGNRVIPMQDVKATGVSAKNVINIETPQQQPKKITSATATDLADQKTAIEMVPDLFKKALNIKGLTYTPADIIKAQNPFDTGAKEYAQIIASTKQIIGKGLEGGVLRKEDEYKYGKIIPAMGDTKEVLEAKSRQLQEMLVRKYNNTLDAQEQAGYDVSRFNREQVKPIQLPSSGNSKLKAIEEKLGRKLNDAEKADAKKRGLI